MEWIHQQISRYLRPRVRLFQLKITHIPRKICPSFYIIHQQFNIDFFVRLKGQYQTKLTMSFDRNGNFHFKLELKFKCISIHRESGWRSTRKKHPLKAKRIHIKERACVGVHLERPFSKQSPLLTPSPPLLDRQHYGNGAFRYLM